MPDNLKEDSVRIVVDYSKWTGLGMCEAEAAVESCPTEALSIVED
jgi:ferredoxin